MNAVLNRRAFLTATATAGAGLALEGWRFGISAAPAPTPTVVGSALIDTHTHFYDPSRPEGVPWPPRDDKLLYRRVLPKDYRDLPVPKVVTGTVVVEASPWLEDNQWVLDLAADDPFIVGFVGNLQVGTKGFAGHLKRFAANQLFRGIRIGSRKLDGTQESSDFLGDLKSLADRDLSLDLLGGIGILAFANRLAKEISSLRIIIDHLAGVKIDGKAPPSEWVREMRALVPKQNIYFKLSGLVEGTGRTDGSAPRDVDFYRPVLDVLRGMFGADRLIYASNWPVSERFAPLATVQGIVADYFRGYGEAVQKKVFSGSAEAAYRWLERRRPK